MSLMKPLSYNQFFIQPPTDHFLYTYSSWDIKDFSAVRLKEITTAMLNIKNNKH